MIICHAPFLYVRGRAKVLRAFVFGSWFFAVPSCVATIPGGPSAAPALSEPEVTASLDAITTKIPYADAAPILQGLPEELPEMLKGKSPYELEAAWAGWTSHHDAEIRARISRGDEDSVVNFWRYGTSFTRLPRLTTDVLATLGHDSSREQRMLHERLEDLIAGMEWPGTNERLRFVRDVLQRQHIDPTTPTSKDEARRFLIAAYNRMLHERDTRDRRLQSPTILADPEAQLRTVYTLFGDRGLSSDTSITSSFSLEQALTALKSQGLVRAGGIRRVAIVGPGLDFTDKEDGYDFYPQQTIQPFAAIDSLIRLGLVPPDGVRLMTFDLNPRVNDHLNAAGKQARAGVPYLLHLPLDRRLSWNPELVAFWRRLGDRIGTEVTAPQAPSSAGNVEVRAISVHPNVVRSTLSHELNIVLERRLPRSLEDQFDMIVATNVLFYYDVFEQNLALANVASMLRPGGLFITNTVVVPAIPLTLLNGYARVVHKGDQGDRMFSYRRVS